MRISSLLISPFAVAYGSVLHRIQEHQQFLNDKSSIAGGSISKCDWADIKDLKDDVLAIA